MLKILGSAMVIISSTLIGLMLAGKYRQRMRELKEIRNSFQMIETEIFYTATPIIEVMEKISRQASKPLDSIFKDIYKNLKKREGDSLASIWENAFTKWKGTTCFSRDDLESINFFGSILGTSDRQSQIKNAKLVQSQLIRLEEHAESEWKKNEKLYRNLGILLGIAVVIILI